MSGDRPGHCAKCAPDQPAPFGQCLVAGCPFAHAARRLETAELGPIKVEHRPRTLRIDRILLNSTSGPRVEADPADYDTIVLGGVRFRREAA